ncbi:hypothetical protein BZG36_04716 [Bifiguratus adelaidae]|uniref:Uncharacterized protein n=1 Tax=Bifiguratus adelaidae TaxID=1938954 RepID=A0A261XV21_9FUNG|nr:hypothetical protein BZG36_04716 [Bifiguratus adelaidae]
MSGFFAPQAGRSLRQFLATDPEIFPLMGVLGAMIGTAGYMLGHKRMSVTSESNVRMATNDARYPWQQAEPEEFAYRYHIYGDSKQPVVAAPSAIVQHSVEIQVPKGLAEKYPGIVS